MCEEIKEEDLTMFLCERPGLCGITPVRMKIINGRYVSRMGFAMFGSTNLTDEEMMACGYNPFHPEWYDNYCEGIGNNIKESLDDLETNMASLYESMWI